MARPWIPLRLSPAELRCQVSLTNGQSFAWQPTAFTADERASADDAAPAATSSSSSPPLQIASPRKSSKLASLPQQRPVEWCGVLGTHIVSFKESETDTLFRVENPSSSESTSSATSTDAAERAVRDYLRADASLEELVVKWTAADTRFAQVRLFESTVQSYPICCAEFVFSPHELFLSA
jgi:hypothetical protein